MKGVEREIGTTLDGGLGRLGRLWKQWSRVTRRGSQELEIIR